MSDTPSLQVPVASRLHRTLGVAAAAVAVAIWAGWIVWTDTRVSREDGGPGFTPFDIAILRFGAPALLLAPVWLRPLWRAKSVFLGLLQSVKPPTTPLWALLMMFGWGAPFVFFASRGLAESGPALMAAMVPGAVPLYAAALAIVFFGVSPRKSARPALLLIAVAALFGLFAAPADSRDGALWFAAAALGWAGYIVAFPRSGLAPIQAVGLLSVWSSAVLLILAPFAESNLFEIQTSFVVTELILQGVIAGVVSIVAYTIALAWAPPLIAMSLPAGVPILTSVFALLFGDTAPHPLQLVGLVLASAGLLHLAWSSYQAPAPRV